MKIVFVHPHKAFLPDIAAYTEFFERHSIECETATLGDFSTKDRDVEWFFMGLDRWPRTQGICRIHEYVSASLPPWSFQKDLLKRYLNTRPDFRIYQNPFVKDRMGFSDPLPFGFRLPCLSPLWSTPVSASEKKFDFVYIGDLSPYRGIHRLLDHFCGPMREHSLLVLSKEYGKLQSKYAHAGNIFFEGPYPQEEVRKRLLQCRFAVNYIPDTLPFSKQVSTKLLEYAACRIPIISTDYSWMREFEQTQGGKYFYVSNDLRNFSWKAVNEFTYAFPDLQEYQSEVQIRRSGIMEFLKSRFSLAEPGRND